MQKKFKLASGKVLLMVEVPEKAETFELEIYEFEDWYQLIYHYVINDFGSHFNGQTEKDTIELPRNPWKLLGKPSDIPSEVLDKLMPNKQIQVIYLMWFRRFKNFMLKGRMGKYEFATSQQSLQSLITSLGLKNVVVLIGEGE